MADTDTLPRSHLESSIHATRCAASSPSVGKNPTDNNPSPCTGVGTLGIPAASSKRRGLTALASRQKSSKSGEPLHRPYAQILSTHMYSPKSALGWPGAPLEPRAAYPLPQVGPMLAAVDPSMPLCWPYLARFTLCWPKFVSMLSLSCPNLTQCWPKLALSCPYVDPIFPLCWPYLDPRLPRHVDKFVRTMCKHLQPSTGHFFRSGTLLEPHAAYLYVGPILPLG